jgi:formylglycine-generating enzyme required for sulfatase activity
MPSQPFGLTDNHPVVNVSWYDIMGTDGTGGYCAWASSISGVNLSLPTESRWEFAATGGDGRNFPWGGYGPITSDYFYPGWDASRCVSSRIFEIKPVGSIPAGNSPFGCSDMAGNVWEWCFDSWADESGKKVTKGGSFGDAEGALFLCAGRGRYWNDPEYGYIGNGFRLSAGPK